MKTLSANCFVKIEVQHWAHQPQLTQFRVDGRVDRVLGSVSLVRLRLVNCRLETGDVIVRRSLKCPELANIKISGSGKDLLRIAWTDDIDEFRLQLIHDPVLQSQPSLIRETFNIVSMSKIYFAAFTAKFCFL